MATNPLTSTILWSLIRVVHHHHHIKVASGEETVEDHIVKFFRYLLDPFEGREGTHTGFKTVVSLRAVLVKVSGGGGGAAATTVENKIFKCFRCLLDPIEERGGTLTRFIKAVDSIRAIHVEVVGGRGGAVTTVENYIFKCSERGGTLTCFIKAVDSIRAVHVEVVGGGGGAVTTVENYIFKCFRPLIRPIEGTHTHFKVVATSVGGLHHCQTLHIDDILSAMIAAGQVKGVHAWRWVEGGVLSRGFHMGLGSVKVVTVIREVIRIVYGRRWLRRDVSRVFALAIQVFALAIQVFASEMRVCSWLGDVAWCSKPKEVAMCRSVMEGFG
ncbi:hypothetical protein NE237_030513 [Protea cynaroides]|uniref:Uncharacterized protein n=1 Tax=Protea cynaroides TaxID=273540 RepID=A0A9Q0GV84_9MAGN|nr:hypothetical protein NE237_030513 [Protea cynaroides]